MNNDSTAERLEKQLQDEREIFLALTQKELTITHKKYQAILKKELSTIARDIQHQTRALPWKVLTSRLMWPLATGLLFCVGMMIGAWGISRHLSNQITQISQAKATLAQLESQGSKIQFGQCGGQRRLCIKMDEAAGSYKDNHRIPLGY
jgi:hypothetical protein